MLICVLVALAGAVGYFALSQEGITDENCMAVSRRPHIRPDYAEMVIPPNIAPLNFVITEPGARYLVKIHCGQSEVIEVFSRGPQIKIPLRRWQSLLNDNRGNKLFFDVYVKEREGQWRRYESISNTIAQEDIDSHLVYRHIRPASYYPNNMSIHQRRLENYEESLVLDDDILEDGCLNCHAFVNNKSDTMLLGFRSLVYDSGTLLTSGSEVEKLALKIGYTAWHPRGRLAAYSMNKVYQFFHTAGPEIHDVIDLDSAMLYYVVGSRTSKIVPGASEKPDLETYPTWSPDGRYLYYCSAPMLWTDREEVPPKHYDKVRYSLKRIGYELETDTWGEPETVLSAAQTGLSILLPRISPDGRFLLFCMCKYGCFPIYQPSSDLYMMDLQSGNYKKLPINSEHSESWHSWSSNSRWIAFSSKRRGGLFTRIYLSYVDQKGKAYKPFILPQKDPTFYDSFLKTYSLGELITGAVPVSRRTLAAAIRSAESISAPSAISGATPNAEGAQGTEPWRQGPE